MAAKQLSNLAKEARFIMQTDVITTSTSTPLSEVVQLLTDQGISGVPVTNEAGHVVGVLSMRDVLSYYATADVDRPQHTGSFFMTTDVAETGEDYTVPEAAEGVASDVMTAEVFSVEAHETIAAVAKSLADHGIHRVLVHEDRRFVGLIGTLDVLRAIVD